MRLNADMNIWDDCPSPAAGDSLDGGGLAMGTQPGTAFHDNQIGLARPEETTGMAWQARRFVPFRRPPYAKLDPTLFSAPSRRQSVACKYSVPIHFRFVSYRPAQSFLLFTSAQDVFSRIGIDLQIASDMMLPVDKNSSPYNSELDKKVRDDPLVTTCNLDSPSGLQQFIRSNIVPLSGVVVVFLPGDLIGFKSTGEREQNNACTALISKDTGLILVSTSSTAWTLAHELGHLLADYGQHDKEPDHVMKETKNIQLTGGQTAPVFSDEEIKRIYQSPFCKPCN
jgi:hypothetical protein